MGTRLSLVSAALLLLVLQARQSTGYFSPDEYCHSVEFASYARGLTTGNELNSEFPMRIRPFLQPALYAGLGIALESVGLGDPSVALFSFRVLGAVLALVAACLLARALSPSLSEDRHRRILLAASLFTWYLPFLSVRTSQENLSGSLIALGLASWLLLASRPAAAALLAGSLFGLSFDVRYQAAFAGVGFFGWLVFVRRPRWTALASFVSGVALAVAVGLAVDRWGYGEFTFTPWNYFRVNLLEGYANQFGKFPVSYYFTELLTVHPPLSALLLLCVALYCIRAPLAPITWITIPFCVGHSLLAHKELRFLFPLGPLAAVVPPLLLFDPGIRLPRLRSWLARNRAIPRYVVALNLAFIVALLLVPVRHDQSVQLTLARRLAEATNSSFLLLEGAAFFPPCPPAFLRPHGLQVRRVSSWADTAAVGDGSDELQYVVAPLGEFPPEALREQQRLRLAAAPLPEWMARLLARPLRRTALIALWSRDPRPSVETPLVQPAAAYSR